MHLARVPLQAGPEFARGNVQELYGTIDSYSQLTPLLGGSPEGMELLRSRRK
jgi:hypothetical protein